MKWILFLFVILLPVFGSSQSREVRNPGYLGKHFLLSAEGSFSGSIFLMKEYYFKYGGAAELVLGKHFSMGLSYMHNSIETSNYSKSDDCYFYPSFTFATNAYSLDFYFYPSRSIAPVGSFLRLQATYFRNYTNNFYQNKVIYYNKDPYSCPGYGPSADTLRGSNIGISIFYGRKRIFYNTLVVSYGVQFGYTFSNPMAYNIRYGDSAYEEQQIFYKAVCYENFFSSLIVLKASVGVIW